MTIHTLRIYLAQFVVVGLFFFTACESDQVIETNLDASLVEAIENASTDGTIDYFRLPDADDYSSIPHPALNPMTPEKVELGKLLFFEPAVGLDPFHEEGRATYTCGTCHLPSAGFRQGNVPQGVADGGLGLGVNGEGRVKNPLYADDELDVQNIRPLSVLNVAFVPNTFWNGQWGANDLNAGRQDLYGTYLPETELNHEGMTAMETQNIVGLETHRMLYNPQIVDSLGYKELFDKSFPEFHESQRYSRRTASFALSTYLRSLIADRAPFQRWLRGDYKAMTDQEKRGALVFFDKGNCSACHSEKNLGSNRFFAIGVNDLDMIPTYLRDPNSSKNLGRGSFTGNPEDMFKFKVPQLYNVGETPFFFHGSSKTSLEEVVEYFNQAIPENPRVPKEQIAAQFRPLNLTEQEKEDLVAFLRNGLRDPDLERYAPEHVYSGLCFPNNDERARYDMGCN